MEPNPDFRNQSKAFWANVRLISEQVGYTQRKEKKIKVPTKKEVEKAYKALSLNTTHLWQADGSETKIGHALMQYFSYRAQVLNGYVEPKLMDATRAKREFELLQKKLKPNCPLPMNKQKGEKRQHAYLTCIVNMIVEANCNGFTCDYDPRSLATVTLDGLPYRTLARRVDGAFPSTVNPLALWEIKEYYHTTTFGSRVADGVYESLLDGMELEEISTDENIKIIHLLMIDAHYTWWQCGRSYLCRIIDMLHMGYVDEVLFGYEVIEKLPGIIKALVKSHKENIK